ncbi:glycine-rich protein-like [Macrobrachium nipponense]|uniref:glycine-rich protein-like n=1 Tax=Macrobrachium nipponense TaxID=159736 RepID=UPI0030C83703
MRSLIAILSLAFVANAAPGLLGLGGLGLNGGFGGGYGGAGGILSAGNYANGFSHSKGYSHGNHILGGFKGLGGIANGHLNKHFLGKRSADPEPGLLGLGLGGLGLNSGLGGGFGGYGGLLGAGNYANGYSHSTGYSHGNHILKGFGGAGGLKHGHLKHLLLGKRSADLEPDTEQESE